MAKVAEKSKVLQEKEVDMIIKAWNVYLHTDEAKGILTECIKRAIR